MTYKGIIVVIGMQEMIKEQKKGATNTKYYNITKILQTFTKQ